jgi:CotH kinase protein/Lamin Tail Domain
VDTNVVVSGTNILAIQGLNLAMNNSDFLILGELVASSVVAESTNALYFTVSTPGSNNSGGVTVLGPVITEVGHSPNVPLDHEDVTVTARVEQSFANAFVTNVTLRYRIMFAAEVLVPMFDDGMHGDGAAGDFVFGGTIPASASTNGQMIRYQVRASDSQGNSSRWPLFFDPAGSAEYLGTIVNPTNLTSKLPIMHLFGNTGVVGPGPTTTQTGADSPTGGRVSFFFDGEFYDNIYMALRGNSTANYAKKSHRVEFNAEHRLRHPGASNRVRKTSFVADYPDPSYIRQRLSFWLCNQMGAPAPFYYPVRLQLNGNFYQLANHSEVNGDDLAGNLGYDENGAFYKAAGQVTPGQASTGGFEKLNPRDGNNSDYTAFATAIGEAQPLATRRTNIFDQVNVPEAINYMAVARWIHENDDVWANMTLYRDTFGNKEWSIIPFDLNLSWGAIFAEGSSDLFNGIQSTNDNHKAHPLYGSSQTLALSGPGGAYNRMYDSFFQVPQTREMFLRRVRTLMDAYVKPPGTPTNELVLEPMILQWRDQLAEEALRDRSFWSWPGQGGQNSFPTPPNPAALEFTNAVNGLLNEFIGRRRSHFYVKHSITNATPGFPVGITKTSNAGIPLSQPAASSVSIAGVEFNPASSNQLEEYVCVTNPQPYAVDISGWKVDGGVSFTFKPGTVMPGNSVLYLSPDVNAFRARAATPRGGQGHFVQGPYQGQLSARGESLTITDTFGRQVSSNSYVGNPSLAQQHLRITEIMYSPSLLAGNTNAAQEFEYIELKNISGSVTLNLNGIRFINGIEFNFAGSAITSLLPGARVLVVGNVALFTARYGGGLPVAGQFTNTLDNAGERIQLVDNFNEEIHDFSYNNSWYPITDGFGFSLVTVNEGAEPDLWDSKTNWRPSGVLGGGPGVVDPPTPEFGTILVNELLSHTDDPLRDQVELLNASTNDVNIGGWFLTDDFRTPKKYRFTNGTIIPAGGYLVIDETQFSNSPPALIAFALSGNGDEAWVFSGDANTNLTGYVSGEDYGAAATGVSFGRYTNSQGKVHFVAQSANTFNAANAAPAVGPIVFSEIHYHPVDLPGGVDDSTNEFIELRNITGSPVELFDAAAPTNTWRLRGGADFGFPTNLTLAAGESLLLVNFQPTNAAALAAFKARYAVPPSVTVLGPYEGKLNNDSDDLKLERPDSPNAGEVPYILVDRVEYQDSDGWPAAADGTGASLQRINVAAYGNDPINWVAAATSAGTNQPAGSAPIITSQPASQSGLGGQSVMFSVTATGTAPLRYQWFYKGATIQDATNSILSLSSVAFSQSGPYSVIVYNGVGNVQSSNAVLDVLIPAIITLQPVDVDVRIRPDNNADVAPVTNATFTVSVASANPPINYLWRVNGLPITATNIFGINSATLLVSNVVMDNFGAYSCQVTDGNGSLSSASATLYPLVRPLVAVGPPNPLIVPAAQPVPVSVVLSNGWPPPFGYQWRSNALAIATPVSNSKTNFFVIPSAYISTNAINSTFRVIVSNRAVPTFQVAQSATFTLTTLLDADRDGIPDSTEIALGLMTNNAADALLDLDGDGASNLAEYQAGTNPNDTNSFLRVDIQAMNNMANILVAAVSNRTYTVQYSDVLPASWNKLADLFARATNRVESINDWNWTTNRFYRIALPAQ